VVAVGYYIRRSLDETPAFQAESAEEDVPRAPLAELFKNHWTLVLRVVFAAFIASVNTIFGVFALSFATSDDYGIGISSTTMLWIAIVANVFAIGVIPLWATLSDRVGRKPVFLSGLAGSAVMVTVFLWAISEANTPLVVASGILLAGFVYSMPNACWPSTYAEYFPTSVRLSGMAIGTQFGFALAGFSPSIAAALTDGDPSRWWAVAGFAVLACLISAIAVGTGPKRTHVLPMEELGRKSKDDRRSVLAA
jgi:MFS family permease